jgi:integrase
MARSIRNSHLETRTARLGKLVAAAKPYYVKLYPGLHLGYRRTRAAGTWVARIADGSGGNWVERLGLADDYEQANSDTILDYRQAQDAARERASKPKRRDAPKPMTVGEALERYYAELVRRGADTRNISRVRRLHLPLDIAVRDLKARQLLEWRDRVPGQPATINRVCTVLKAALNLAAKIEGITDRGAWQNGLAAIHSRDTEERDRNVILTEGTVRQLVGEARKLSHEFGLLVDVLAITGARVSQVARCRIHDLQVGETPRLVVPSSRKGSGTKLIARRAVPISPALADRLKVATAGRGPTNWLLIKPSGERWKRGDHSVRFSRVVRAVGEDPCRVTIYALRHTNIVRQLLANVPIRVVAVNHDTSVLMIERTYSRHIGDHSDALARGALLDVDEVTENRVVPLRA